MPTQDNGSLFMLVPLAAAVVYGVWLVRELQRVKSAARAGRGQSRDEVNRLGLRLAVAASLFMVFLSGPLVWTGDLSIGLAVVALPIVVVLQILYARYLQWFWNQHFRSRR